MSCRFTKESEDFYIYILEPEVETAPKMAAIFPNLLVILLPRFHGTSRCDLEIFQKYS